MTTLTGALKSAHLHQLVGLGAVQTVPAGSAIMIAGTRPDVIYVLLAGRIRVHAAGKRSRPFERPGAVIWAEGRAQFSCSMHTEGALLSIERKSAAAAGLLGEFARDALSAKGVIIDGADPAPHDLICVAHMLDGLKCKRALDLGSGGGRLAEVLTVYSSMTIRLDANQEVFTRPNAGIATTNGPAPARVCARFEALPFCDGSFDMLASRLALHESRSHRKALSEARRVLRRGGTLLVIDVVPPAQRDAAELFDALEVLLDPEYARPPCEPEWRALLHTSGFRIDKIARTQVHRELAHRPNGEAERESCAAVARAASPRARKGLSVEFSGEKLTWRDQRIVLVARAA